ncbi:hypothetical protein, partial [Planktothrix agardhii]|uniref:hypothetical protein n=1 Tax=Planktothrix agardhii TaxID=1160 RepID=UPI0028A77AC9
GCARGKVTALTLELDRVRGELLERDNAIANLQTQISGVVTGNNDQVLTIAELESELSGVTLELKAREVAIANLKAELEARGDKQMDLCPGQEPTPEPKAKSKAKSKPGTVDRLTVGTPELVEYINSIAPGSGIKAKTINNAITRHLESKGEGGEGGQGKNLSSLESIYNFKYLGKVGNSHKFSIPNL